MLDLFNRELFLRNDCVFYVPVIKEYFRLVMEKFPILNSLSISDEGDFFFVLTNDEEMAKKIWLSCGDSSYFS